MRAPRGIAQARGKKKEKNTEPKKFVGAWLVLAVLGDGDASGCDSDPSKRAIWIFLGSAPQAAIGTISLGRWGWRSSRLAYGISWRLPGHAGGMGVGIWGASACRYLWETATVTRSKKNRGGSR